MPQFEKQLKKNQLKKYLLEMKFVSYMIFFVAILPLAKNLLYAA